MRASNPLTANMRVFQLLQAIARVIALVRDQLGRVLRRRGGINRRQIGCGRLERPRQGGGVALIGRVDVGRDDGRGIQIDRGGWWGRA